MSVANLKKKIMITVEEFFRNKIKEKSPEIEVITLSRELITAEEGMRWAHEFKQLHLHAVSGRSEQLCRIFFPDGKTTSATKCQFCGKEKWEH